MKARYDDNKYSTSTLHWMTCVTSREQSRLAYIYNRLTLATVRQPVLNVS